MKRSSDASETDALLNPEPKTPEGTITRRTPTKQQGSASSTPDTAFGKLNNEDGHTYTPSPVKRGYGSFETLPITESHRRV